MHTFYLLKHKQEMKVRNVHIPYSAIGQKVWYTLDRLTRCQFYSYLWTLELFNPCVFLHERAHANSTQRGPSLLVDLNPGPSRCETTANHWSILLSLLKNDVWISVENVSQSWYNLHASITLTWTGSYLKKNGCIVLLDIESTSW